MAKTPSIETLLRKGSVIWNAKRFAGDIARDQTGATIESVSISRADLSSLELVGTEWANCELYAANFQESDLSNAYFHGGRLEHCNFQGADLSGATFEDIQLVRCDFSGARGLDAIELEEVEMHEVEGLGASTESSSRDGLIRLGDRLPKGYHAMSLEQLVAAVKKIAQVNIGAGGTDAEVTALEAACGGATGPADYRAFLTTFGHLEIEANADYGFGTLHVFGLGTLEGARQRYADAFKEWAYPEGWLEQRIEPVFDSRSLEQKRERLADTLKLSESDVANIIGDDLDAMRIAYRGMVPVIATPDEFHRVVKAIGPGGKLYTVSIKERDVESPRGTFTAQLMKAIEQVVVGVG